MQIQDSELDNNAAPINDPTNCEFTGGFGAMLLQEREPSDKINNKAKGCTEVHPLILSDIILLYPIFSALRSLFDALIKRNKTAAAARL